MEIATLLEHLFSPSLVDRKSLGDGLRGKVFENQRYDEEEVASKILKEAQECVRALNASREEKDRLLQQNDTVLTWIPPSKGWFKLNTDASRNSDLGYTAIGGVIRDENGLWIKGFNGAIGTGSIFMAELRALRDGMLVAWDMDIKLLMIESDSIAAVNAIRDSDTESEEAYPLIKDCRDLLKRNWRVHVLFQPREKNKVPDAMARLGHDQHCQLHIHEQPPSEVQGLLANDCMNSVFLRN